MPTDEDNKQHTKKNRQMLAARYKRVSAWLAHPLLASEVERVASILLSNYFLCSSSSSFCPQQFSREVLGLHFASVESEKNGVEPPLIAFIG
jgi:hypothetical protein